VGDNVGGHLKCKSSPGLALHNAVYVPHLAAVKQGYHFQNWMAYAEVRDGTDHQALA
jgi:hypothetical protein